jgi:periplasmic divalent cation tolerance protein
MAIIKLTHMINVPKLLRTIGWIRRPIPTLFTLIGKGLIMTEILTVFVTTANEEEAVHIAKTIVTERLAACANMVSGLRSIYRWKGEICDTEERLLMIKTRAPLFPSLEKRIRALHSYEVPEIVGIPITAGSPAYLQWILENTQDTP